MGKRLDSTGLLNSRSGCVGKIYETSHKGLVGHLLSPRHLLVGQRNWFVGASKLETRDHEYCRRVSIGLTKLVYQFINELFLRQLNSVSGCVLSDRDTKCMFDGAKVKDVPVFLKLLFKQQVLGGVRGSGNDVIDMYHKDDHAWLGMAMIYAPFTGKSFEAKAFNGSVECLVPDPALLVSYHRYSSSVL
jgi:hypothetical protein